MKNIFMALCYISAVYGLIGYIKSKGQSEKMTGFICSVALLLSFFSLFRGASFTLPKREMSSQTVNIELSEEAFADSIEDMLIKKGIKIEKVIVSSSIKDEGSISINEIKVKGEDALIAVEIIRENTGLTKEVKVYEQ